MGEQKSIDPVVQFKAIQGENFFKISDYDKMPPFFISLVSSGNLWLFLSSHGGVTAGRQNKEHSLFPYYTEDKIIDMAESTGSHAIIRWRDGESFSIWEPFSIRGEGQFNTERNIYKNFYGNIVVFEEINKSIGLTYRYAWLFSNKYGIVKRSFVINNGNASMDIEIIDGIQNILPASVDSSTIDLFSVLIDAYKKNELIDSVGLGIYKMSSLLSDVAEPSEALKATTVWSLTGEKFYSKSILLSSRQIDLFRRGLTPQLESEALGSRGAYYSYRTLHVGAGDEIDLYIVADVDQTQGMAKELEIELNNPDKLKTSLEGDIIAGRRELEYFVGLSDGLQKAGVVNTTVHHYANTMFNIMRGGIFSAGYNITSVDFIAFLKTSNKDAVALGESLNLPAEISYFDLKKKIDGVGDTTLQRLFWEYLPLSFSRRHGDPSRPWNQFSIDLQDDAGNKRLTYQGNWRDIFQNWEALALSFPEYLFGMISKFLNGVTLDGYNPYRVTREGMEWEIPEPENPWSNIGYWGDHQIIYLLKLLEMERNYHPGSLERLLSRPVFSHLNIPYKIKPYSEIEKDFRNTIIFDEEKHKVIEERFAQTGADGKLVLSGDDKILHSTLLEKLLILICTKVSNFVPGGGIWMNTQRPEWNDANNALVGPGLSMVTLSYLRRFTLYLIDLLKNSAGDFTIDTTIADFLNGLNSTLESGSPNSFFDNILRRKIVDSLGQIGSDYREKIYVAGLSGDKAHLSCDSVVSFLNLFLTHIDATLSVNLRDDGLYHSYNLIVLKDNGNEKEDYQKQEKTAEVHHLYEMLEGQVAILSSGYLDSESSKDLLQALRKSALYRKDQNSYILYPDRKLPDFFEMNRIPEGRVETIVLLREMAKAGDTTLISPDPSENQSNAKPVYRFAAYFKNAGDLSDKLDQLALDNRWSKYLTGGPDNDRKKILDLYEEVFDHKSFTGRSGTFYAYEGLGSIYWHMVSKLMLATQENLCIALDNNSSEATTLRDLYYDVRGGLCFHKTAKEYGAFPTDPYSHTPRPTYTIIGEDGKPESVAVARQPGMTGQVKEGCIARFGELGLSVTDGVIEFVPRFLEPEEFLTEDGEFEYVDAQGAWGRSPVKAGSLAFTYCGLPLFYISSDKGLIIVSYSDGTNRSSESLILTKEESLSIFRREGMIKEIRVNILL